jgi:hypothetical protein
MLGRAREREYVHRGGEGRGGEVKEGRSRPFTHHVRGQGKFNWEMQNQVTNGDRLDGFAMIIWSRTTNMHQDALHFSTPSLSPSTHNMIVQSMIPHPEQSTPQSSQSTQARAPSFSGSLPWEALPRTNYKGRTAPNPPNPAQRRHPTLAARVMASHPNGCGRDSSNAKETTSPLVMLRKVERCRNVA